ncbi:Sua5/YciO/YrdC/YwlC family protein, partial [uncultured Muribaculum sp.]
MKILKFYPGSVNERNIAEAVDIIRSGGIVIYPTDTLYALGCDALNNRAIERLCRIKGLDPARQMLSVVCEGLSQAAEYARID